MSKNNNQMDLNENSQISGFITDSLPRILFFISFVSLVLSSFFIKLDSNKFFFSYLTSYIFYLTISLGSMFFVLVFHLTRSGWSVVIRRIAEHLMKNVWVFLLLFVPIIFGMYDLYHWTHMDAVAHDHLLQVKFPYLNKPFFFLRVLFYFFCWIFIANRFFNKSVSQDITADSSITRFLQRSATFSILLYALTQSFAFIDWVMSLTPHWYSTIFGVYFFGGSAMVSMCVITLLAIFLRTKGFLRNIITVEHYHDMGKLSYGFMVFWSYIAFSQFFLIWYANIPEETLFFKEHFFGSWTGVTTLLCVGHFAVPFLLFMSRHVKRNLVLHSIMAIWLVFMHYVDVFWVIMPNVYKSGFSYSIIDFLVFVGIGSLFFGLFFKRINKSFIIPVSDPRINESLSFKNH